MLIILIILSGVSNFDKKATAHFNVFDISAQRVTVSKYFMYIVPFFLRYEREVFAVHTFLRVYSKS